jgi:hypothetical protein
MKVNPLIHLSEVDLRHRRGDEGIRSNPIGGLAPSHLRAIFECQSVRLPAPFLSRLDMRGKNVRAAPLEDLAPPNQVIGTAQCATAATPETRSSGFIYRQGELGNAPSASTDDRTAARETFRYCISPWQTR